MTDKTPTIRPAASISIDCERYAAVETVTKKYPSCTANHVAIDAAVKLANENVLASSSVFYPSWTGLSEGYLGPATTRLKEGV